MKRLFWWLWLLPVALSAFERLEDKYLVTYGDPEAPNRVVEYYSVACPNCVELFCTDFHQIRRLYLDTGRVYWVFHPVPADLLTVQTMACLELLPEKVKRVFLEEILSYAREEEESQWLAVLMRQIVMLTGNDVGDLADLDALEKRPAFESAYLFIKGGGLEVEAVPTLEFNGELQTGELPSVEAIHWLVERGGR